MQWVERLARNLCRKNGFAAVEVGDLVQEGLIGLMDAAARYRPETNVPFTAFARTRVQGAMLDALRRQSWPRQMRKIRRTINKGREEFLLAYGREPMGSELAALLGWSEKRLGKNLASIEALRVVNGAPDKRQDFAGRLVSEIFPVVDNPDYVPRLDLERHRPQLQTAIKSLPERERKVITMLYWEELSRKQVAKKIGVSESRVSQIHTRAVSIMSATMAA